MPFHTSYQQAVHTTGFDLFNTEKAMCPTNISCLSSTVIPGFTESRSADSIEVTAEELGLAYLVSLVVLNSFFSLIGTLGNALVLGAIIQNEYLRSIPDVFIFSLATSDLMVAAFYQPINAYHLSNYNGVHAAVKAVMSFLGHMSLIASVTNIFCITVERLISIRFPLKYALYVTHRRAFYAIAAVWVISLIFGAVYAKRSASTLVLQVYFSLLLLGTVIMYTYILIIAKKQENAVTDLQGMNQNNAGQERKAARTVAIILGVGLVCWLPLLMTPAFVDRELNPVKFFRVFYVLQTISICNSSINPYVYCVRSRRYRWAFAKLLGLRRMSDLVHSMTLDHDSRTVRGT